jgi:hypothetical protein
MLSRIVADLRSWPRREEGGVAVEFAVLLPLFLVLVFGVIDFGHAWYMDHMLSNASREGARYATRYVTDVHSHRLLPQNLTPTISNYVIHTSDENGGLGGWGLAASLPTDANPQVSVSGPGVTTTDPSALAGKDLTVRVMARKTWFVLGSLLPWLGSYRDLAVQTTMKCE